MKTKHLNFFKRKTLKIFSEELNDNKITPNETMNIFGGVREYTPSLYYRNESKSVLGKYSISLLDNSKNDLINEKD